jgi:hypothetical protein
MIGLLPEINFMGDLDGMSHVLKRDSQLFYCLSSNDGVVKDKQACNKYGGMSERLHVPFQGLYVAPGSGHANTVAASYAMSPVLNHMFPTVREV